MRFLHIFPNIFISLYFVLARLFCPGHEKKMRFLNLDKGIKDKNVSILTYNIKDLPYPLRSNKKDSFTHIINKINFKDYSIILLQEGFTSATQKYISKFYPYRHLVYPIRNCPKILNNGMWLLSKYEILNIKNFSFEKNLAGYDRLADKSIAHISLKLPNDQIINIINLHFNSNDSSGAPAKRIKRTQKKQFAFLDKIVKQIPTSEKIIICGDFNTGLNNPLFEEFIKTNNFDVAFSEKSTNSKKLDGNDYQKYMFAEEKSNVLFRNVVINKASIDFDRSEQGLKLSDHFGLSITLK